MEWGWKEEFAAVLGLIVLTKREEEILKLAAKGFADKQIAEMSNISVRTVNAHLARIYVKNNVKNRAEAVALYLKKLLKEDPNSSLLQEILL